MGYLFRSEVMDLWQLFLQPETAYTCIAELGEVGVAHFRDLNPGVNIQQRKFLTQIVGCEDMERKIDYIRKELRKQEMDAIECTDNPPAPHPKEMIDLEASLSTLESELKEVNASNTVLKKNLVELTELKYVLSSSGIPFDDCEQNVMEGMDSAIVDVDHSIKFSFVAGVVLRERVSAFERMVWRISQGNALVRLSEIEEPIFDFTTSGSVFKTSFIIFFQGEQLRQKLKKVCEGFRASVYHLPATNQDREEMRLGVESRIFDLNTVLAQSNDHQKRLLVEAAKTLDTRYVKIRKMKAIYHTLNCFNFDLAQKCLIGECWVAVRETENLSAALKRADAISGSFVQSIMTPLQTKITPPTYFKTNKFSYGFQNIVDSYGMANYREVNPAPYAVITFPFLFGVMFGDAGHGFIMTLFALFMVLMEKKIIATKDKGEIADIIFSGRYIILLMGIFSMYTGLIYNDIFSKSINVFGSKWYSYYSNETLEDSNIDQLQLNPNQNITVPSDKNFDGEPYCFGIDPIWQLAINKLTYLDSYKMKLSVLLGVIHMLFGITMGIFNHIYFKRYVDIFIEFIPRIIFLSLMFGYLDVLIVWKWFKYSGDNVNVAPNLLITLINMFLGKNPDHLMYDSQKTVQQIFVLVAILCVPWMLLIKPFVSRAQYRRRVAAQSYRKIEEGDIIFLSAEEHEEPFEMGEAFVHQSIHTIDFCLGCISNTASYLRLWALSLAHNQLSDVLWTLVMRIGFVLTDNYYGGGVLMFFIFAFWATLTISILLIMEGLSAFLHALRLHWVEFMNKFFVGDGYTFAPLSFRVLLSGEEEE